jgi:hypothetical protein
MAKVVPIAIEITNSPIHAIKEKKAKIVHVAQDSPPNDSSDVFVLEVREDSETGSDEEERPNRTDQEEPVTAVQFYVKTCCELMACCFVFSVLGGFIFIMTFGAVFIL